MVILKRKAPYISGTKITVTVYRELQERKRTGQKSDESTCSGCDDDKTCCESTVTYIEGDCNFQANVSSQQ